jgi:hypothetical protein
MAAKSPSVEAFLADLEHQRKPEVEALRQAILSGVPGLTERIKWNAPSFGPGDDDRITMRLQPGDRLQLVLHRGAKARPVDGFTFSDPAALIAWAAADRGVVTIAPGELDQLRAALVDLLRRWVAATT